MCLIGLNFILAGSSTCPKVGVSVCVGRCRQSLNVGCPVVASNVSVFFCVGKCGYFCVVQLFPSVLAQVYLFINRLPITYGTSSSKP